MKKKILVVITGICLSCLLSCGGSGTKNPNAPFVLVPNNDDSSKPDEVTGEICSDPTHSLTFSWSKNPDPVNGYQIHKGQGIRMYEVSIDVALTDTPDDPRYTFTSAFDFETPYYFAATAYNEFEVSGFSQEVRVIYHCVDGQVSLESMISTYID